MGIAIAVIFYAYIASTRLLTIEYSEADASFSAHKVMEYMIGDLRKSPQVITANPQNITFWYQDLNNNGTVESNETITYSWTGGTIDAVTKTIGGSSVILANDILSFSLTYETPSAVKLVKIVITAGKNNILSTLESSVYLRNM